MMEAYTYELGWLLASLFIGVSLGSLTGLIPGFHVNNVALILLALSPALLEIGIPLKSFSLAHTLSIQMHSSKNERSLACTNHLAVRNLEVVVPQIHDFPASVFFNRFHKPYILTENKSCPELR